MTRDILFFSFNIFSHVGMTIRYLDHQIGIELLNYTIIVNPRTIFSSYSSYCP